MLIFYHFLVYKDFKFKNANSWKISNARNSLNSINSRAFVCLRLLNLVRYCNWASPLEIYHFLALNVVNSLPWRDFQFTNILLFRFQVKFNQILIEIYNYMIKYWQCYFFYHISVLEAYFKDLLLPDPFQYCFSSFMKFSPEKNKNWSIYNTITKFLIFAMSSGLPHIFAHVHINTILYYVFTSNTQIPRFLTSNKPQQIEKWYTLLFNANLFFVKYLSTFPE